MRLPFHVWLNGDRKIIQEWFVDINNSNNNEHSQNAERNLKEKPNGEQEETSIAHSNDMDFKFQYHTAGRARVPKVIIHYFQQKKTMHRLKCNQQACGRNMIRKSNRTEN
jgi:hypothetical protein